MTARVCVIIRDGTTTIVYVTHDYVEAMILADRIVIMRDGNIEQQGTPTEVFERPINTFVATFIGSPPINMSVAVSEPLGTETLLYIQMAGQEV